MPSVTASSNDDRERASGDDAARPEACRQRHGRDREPRQREALRSAGQRDADRDQRLREHPGAGDAVLRALDLLEVAAQHDETDRARARAARASTSRPTAPLAIRPAAIAARAEVAHRCQTPLHVEHAGAVARRGAEPGGCEGLLAAIHQCSRRSRARLRRAAGGGRSYERAERRESAARTRRPVQRSAVSNASTTAGSNCEPAQRRSSVSAACDVHPRAVRAVLGHRVEGVADGDDPRAERDRLAAEAVGVAAAVPALVAGAHDRRDRRERRASCR